MSKSPIHHSLKAEAFIKALERYVDENKPDQLVLKQIQGWAMQWSSSEEDEDKSKTEISSDLYFDPTDVLQGTLTWKSDYMVAEIECSCYWEPHHDSISKQQTGSLYFVMRAKLRFRNKHDNSEGETKKSKEEKKSEEKIRAKMIRRIKQDPYIKRLLPDTDTNTKESPDATILCEARVSAKDISSAAGKLEERVDVTDNVAEGLRRALFSQAESSLDVVEVLLSLPLLPGATHDISIHCPLADRAKLRLLEDAMFDACERAGEDELIDDLKIGSHSAQDSDEGGKKQSKTAQNGSNKRTKR